MRKQITIEKKFCDVCGKEVSGYQNCIICGKEFCYDCTKVFAVEYNHAVYFLGSGDGLYCLDCDKRALENGDNLNLAYRKIRSLKYEVSGFQADFENRVKKAEEELRKVLDEKDKKI